jgi:hypothetical protein
MQKPVSMPFAKLEDLYNSYGKVEATTVNPEYETISVSRVDESSQGLTEEIVIRRKEDGEFFARKIPHTKTASYFDTGSNDMSRYFVVFQSYNPS